jgi:hypothetical protein
MEFRAVMKFLAGGGMFLFLAVGTLVGIRLCLLARRTRQLPELAVGFALLFGGSIGLIFGLLGFHFEQQGQLLGNVLLGAAVLSLAIGSSSLAVFNWSVFHRESRAVRNVVAGVAAVLLSLFILSGVVGHFQLRTDGVGPYFATMQWIRLTVLAWSIYESLTYWRKLRRRMVLGLADPLVTNRMALWGIGMSGAFAANLFSMWSLRNGAAILQVGDVSNLVPAFAGLLAAGCLVFGFLPPAFYVRHITKRTAAA